MARTNSKIESVIDEIEALVEQSRPVRFSATDIRINREEIEALLRDLRGSVPEEIERYRKILSNKEAIEREAQQEADRMLEEVRMKTNEMLSENEISMRARKQADDLVSAAAREAQGIIEDAQAQADQYMMSAQKYLNDMLSNLSGMIYDCIETSTRNTNRFLESLNSFGETVQENLNELNRAPEQEEYPAEESQDNYFYDEPEGQRSIFDNLSDAADGDK